MNQHDKLSVNAIRILAADAVQKAKSGHPGMPLGCAPMAYTLWANHMKHNPKNPKWLNRDRFVLSAGHGSTLLYALLHLFGYGIIVEDLKNFRQDGSLTPGHPEYGHTAGVEVTTGPLGAGMGMAVGMAMAESHLAAVFNKPEFPVIDHYTYVLGGDGCMMEGISSEAFSLAGTLGLDKLIVLYDSNKISIEGDTDIAFTENVQQRMDAFGFQTITVEDGNDLAAINQAIVQAKAEKTKPSFITIKTQIGYGCPAKQGKAAAHGEPLGDTNVEAMRQKLEWPIAEAFGVPEEVYAHYQAAANKGAEAESSWNELFAKYQANFPDMKALWKQYHEQTSIKISAEEFIETYGVNGDKPNATRNLSGAVLNNIKEICPNLFGGSADLAPSNKSYMNDAGDFGKNSYEGRNIHFGVRELAMAAIANGIMVHGGLKSYVATFFVFSDYLKPMARLAALMNLPVTYILTHDSIGVGEDGPTHEPIEQLAMLRAMPNFTVFRPADAKETAAGWYYALTNPSTPTALVLTRQNLPQYANSGTEALKGAYIIGKETKDTPDAILLASGSEVEIAMAARTILLEEKIDVRVVSMPSMDLFNEQSEDYKASILPKEVRARVAIEAGAKFGWGDYVGLDGAIVGMPGFGASGSAEILFKKFGFTAENVISTVKEVMGDMCSKR